MIRSSKTSLKHLNFGKCQTLNNFINTYSDVVRDFIDILWELDDFPSCLPKSITDLVDCRTLSARALQCAAKQAGGIVRGTKAKNKRRLYVLEKLKKEGDLRGVKRLEKAIKKNPFSKPTLSLIFPELDSRFCKLELQSSNSFDMWLTLSSLGSTFGKLCLPLQRHKHFNKLLNNGKIKKGVRLSGDNITFMFDLPDVPKRKNGKTLGIDVGQNTVISASDGFQSKPNNHGYDLKSITEILCRKKKGSRGFAKATKHRDNYINWSINQVNFDGVKVVVRENLKDLRRGRRVGRCLSHWTYPTIVDKLESRCSELGVLIKTVAPSYTSQRCHRCGFTKKSNRQGALFICGACGYTANADLNASLNISLCLPPHCVNIQDKPNRVGFYWFAFGQESIVPAVKEP